MRAALVGLAIVCLGVAGFAVPAGAQNEEVTHCRLTLKAPRAVLQSSIGTAIIRADAHVTCRYLPSSNPAWQRRIKLFAILQRFDSPHNPIPDTRNRSGQMRSVVTEGDYMAHTSVSHVCQPTTSVFYWRARAWAINYSKRGKIGRSKIVASRFGAGECF